MKNKGKHKRFRCSSFTGKEKDSETGYSYFGARYYDSDLSGLFLSVDPMSDKYPSISPYAYCAWNPIKLVDLDGREIINKDYKRAEEYKKTIESLTSKLHSFSGSKREKRQLEREIRKITRNYEKSLQRGLETESAIQEIKSVMPDFFDEIDNLMDEKGNNVDVYVSVTIGLRDEGGIVCGLTSSSYTANNESKSVNGINTVDIQINHAFLSIKGKTLAHEFGHAYFNVKNPFTVRNDLVMGLSASDPQSYSENYARMKENSFIEASKRK